MDYKEKLKLAKEALDSGSYDKDTIEYIFPELKESEDEKVRKEIEQLIQCMHDADPRKERWLTWLEKQAESDETKAKKFLINKGYPIDTNGIFPTYEEMYNIIREGLEKQGEQKSKDKYTFNAIPRLLEMIEPTNRAKSYCQKLIVSLLQEGYTTDAKIVSGYLKRMNGEKVAMATMDEQKDFAPKVEPKFKVGDYVVGKYISGYITEVRDDCYLLDYQGFSIDKQDNYHLWTIHDAKDGDVLAWDDSKCLALFKNILSKNSFISHGFVGHCSRVFSSGRYHDIEGAHPATKEQRDTLEKEMAAAGYTFDFDKKELKKIGQKPA